GSGCSRMKLSMNGPPCRAVARKGARARSPFSLTPFSSLARQGADWLAARREDLRGRPSAATQRQKGCPGKQAAVQVIARVAEMVTLPAAKRRGHSQRSE